MAKVITPSPENETEQPAVASPRQKRKSLPWGRLFFGLIALVILVGLGALAVMGTSGTGKTVTPTTSPTSTTGPTTTTGAANAATAAPLAARPVLNQLAVYPGDFQQLFSAMADGLQRSTDGGKTWTVVPDFKGQNVTALVFDQADTDTPAYLATDRAGLFKSTDGGKTWKNLGLVGRPITRLVAYKRNLYLSVAGPRASVYHSADAGQTFTSPEVNNLPDNLDVQSITIDTTNPQNVYIGTSYKAGGSIPDWGRVKFSDDGGKTWRDLGQWGPDHGDGPSATRPITMLLYAQGDRVYAGDGDALWRLTPDRSSWQPVAGGLPSTGVYGLVTDPQDGIQGLVYAATRDGFYRNSDGQSWQKIATGETSPLFSTTTNQPQTTIWPALVAAQTKSAANSVNGLRSTFLYALSSDGRLDRYENRDFGTEVVSVVPGASNVPDFTPFGGINPVEPVQAPAAGVNDPTKRFFPETGHYIQGEFKSVWEANGGISLYGYPLTEQFQEFDVSDKITKTVQYFERFRFEFDSTKTVRTSLIGYQAIEGQYFPPGRFIATTSVQQYFDETKHTLRGAFFDFWKNNNSLTRFGFPITEEFTEKGADGKDTVYQYFQRAKLAFDPETKKVTIALLGREVLQKRGWIK